MNNTYYCFNNSPLSSERTIDLVLFLEDREGMTWCGISGKKLEPLTPRASQELEFKAIPLLPGLRLVSGIKLLDTFLKRTYPYEELGQVFVIVNDTDNVAKSM